MIIIPVCSKAHGDHFIFIDGEDFDKIKDYTWGISKHDNILYAYTKIEGKFVHMHRLLLDFPKSPVDHKNGVSLDNRRENLRICTTSENGMNQKKQKRKTSSIYKGVYFHKQRQKFTARIKLKQRTIHIGDFENEHDAGKAYNKKAVELFGEFARLNIIKENKK